MPVRGAEISIELAGEPPVSLGALEAVRRIRTGSRRTGEETWTVVGRHAGVEISAQFEDDRRPEITVRARGLEDPRDLVAVHFTGGMSLTQRQAWINGYQSWSRCRMMASDEKSEGTGYWQPALFS